jgi:signal transduction histidine kinase
VSTVQRVAALANVETRPAAAEALAAHLGVDSLMVFIRDPEVGALLPAPGFPQTLAGGRLWRSFLHNCIDQGEQRAELPFPDALQRAHVLGVVHGDESVLALIGGEAVPERVSIVRTMLPLLAAAFSAEHARFIALTHVAAAEESAHQARNLADTLDTTRRELQHAMHTRSEFLGSASHDLKNPLAAIKGTAQILRRRVERIPTPGMEGLLPGLVSIDAAATRMTALIDDLLDLTHGQMDRPIPLERSPTDLVTLARRVIAEFAPTSERHTLVLELNASELVGSWDQRRLERALGNLVSNAIKYSPHGGDISVTVSKQSRPDGEWAVVAVTDRGLGIPGDDLRRVFERFHRGGNVVGRISGTGIGLASVKHTIEAHGGKVTVQSEVGEGSSFVLWLPIDADAVNDPSHEPSSPRVDYGVPDVE